MNESTLQVVMEVTLAVMILGAWPLGRLVVACIDRRERSAKSPKWTPPVPPLPSERNRVARKLGRAALLASAQERPTDAQAHDGVRRVHDNHMNESRR